MSFTRVPRLRHCAAELVPRIRLLYVDPRVVLPSYLAAIVSPEVSSSRRAASVVSG